jgi:hypothetical protein
LGTTVRQGVQDLAGWIVVALGWGPLRPAVVFSLVNRVKPVRVLGFSGGRSGRDGSYDGGTWKRAIGKLKDRERLGQQISYRPGLRLVAKFFVREVLTEVGHEACRLNHTTFLPYVTKAHAAHIVRAILHDSA